MSTSIDLSFTKDPEWIEKRKVIWRSIENIMKGECDRKEISNLKEYFFCGQFLDKKSVKGILVSYFPLASPAGWDYVFKNMVLLHDVFEHNFYYSLSSTLDVFVDQRDELAYWDYYHPKEFQPEVKSRVPIGPDQEFATVHVNPHQIVATMETSFMHFLNASYWNDTPKFIQRIDYFFTSLPELKWEKEKYGSLKPETNSVRQFEALAWFIFDPDMIERKYYKKDDGLMPRMEFRDMLIGRIEGMNDLPQKLKDIWYEVKSRY